MWRLWRLQSLRGCVLQPLRRLDVQSLRGGVRRLQSLRGGVRRLQSLRRGQLISSCAADRRP